MTLREPSTSQAAYDRSVALFRRSVAIFISASSAYLAMSNTRAPRHHTARAARTKAAAVARRVDPRRFVQPPRELTARQREVVVLIARGCTNAEIAQELVVSPGTAANHVAQILNRLGLASRTQIAVWAIQQGLRPETDASAA